MNIDNGILTDVNPEDLEDNVFIIPNVVTVIGEGAFKKCRFVREIIIPKTVTKIEKEAFSGCMVLGGLRIPDGVRTIGKNAFKGCKSLFDINLPESLTSIDGTAFEECTNLRAINVSEKSKSFISVNGVLYSKDKTELVRYPSGREQSIYSVLDGTIRIGEEAFESCHKITRIKLPNSIEMVDERTFFGCKIVPEIELPEAEKYVDDEWYYGEDDEENEEDVSLDRGVINALKKVNGLKRIRIPQTIKNCGLLEDFREIEEINVDENNPFLCSDNGVVFSKDKKELVIYPRGKKDKEYRVPDGTLSISEGAFSKCSNIEKILLPDSLKEIGFLACYRCNNLKEIEIPNGVMNIGFSAFESCEKIKKVKLPNNLKSIRYRTFRSCRQLEEINIPSTIEEIGDSAFSKCPEKIRNKVLQYIRTNPLKSDLSGDWGNFDDQVWINLSNRKFEQVNMNKRLEYYRGHHLKPGHGTWFSLSSRDSESSEWDETGIRGFI